MSGKIYIVGIGPGDLEQMTGRARNIWDEVDIVVGYKTYVDLIRPQLGRLQVISTGMRQEIDRCREAVKLAQDGHQVALISSGDAGVYGMAGILIEILEQEDLLQLPLEIIPGLTAVTASAALLGAPLMHDFAVISLSDLLTPWEVIKKRVRAAAESDFVIALYNPKSHGRTTQIEEVRNIVLEYRSPQTPVGIVREAFRGESSVHLTHLEEFLNYSIDMLSTVIIGNSQTRVIGRYMVTPRGYSL